MDITAQGACATAPAGDEAAAKFPLLSPSTEPPTQVAEEAVAFGGSTALAKTLMPVTLLCSVLVATLAWLVFLAWLLIQASRLLI
jgi:hypothetical protein